MLIFQLRAIKEICIDKIYIATQACCKIIRWYKYNLLLYLNQQFLCWPVNKDGDAGVSPTSERL